STRIGILDRTTGRRITSRSQGGFGHGFLRIRLKSSQVMDQIPGLFRFKILKIRRHWRSVQSGHENAIEILVRLATLKSLPGGEIVDRNRPVLTICKRRSRRPISVSFLSVTLRALHFLVYLPSAVDALLSVGWLRRYRHHRFWLFFTKTWRKGFYIGDEINSLLSGERQPGRHGAS